MIFQQPEFLYYMLPPLFILFGLLLTQKESQEHYFSKEVMDKLRVSANTLTLKARNALFLLMGFFMIVALAGPVIPDGEIEIKAKSADIMIALDISDSMLAEDVYPNRLKLAKEKALNLLQSAPNERIGVIAFAKNSYLVSPLSFDHGAVSFLLNKLNTDSITEKGTDFLSMLEVVKNSINVEGKKYLLIFSDGGDSSDFSDEISYAKENNIVVFIMGVGTAKGAPIKLKDGTFIKHNGDIIVSKLNESIVDLATKSGGVYIESVKSTSDIEAMLREIEAKSDEKELKSEKVQRFIPLFYYPVGMAMILLLIATSSMSRRQSVPLPALLLFLALYSTPNAEAGLLDFMELNEAKKAYESGDYEKANTLYSQHAQSSQNAESYYNAGNSLYKQAKYKEAIESYEKARFDTPALKAKNMANIANSYAKQKNLEDLKKALKHYEKSLKLQEDKLIRENLEAVKKEIQREKKDENSEDKKSEDNKSKEGDEDKSEDKEGEKSEDDQDKEDEGKESDKKSDKSKEPKDTKEQDKESQSEKNEENNETSEPQKKSLDELQKNEDNKTKESTPPQQSMNQNKMSDAEEKKWLNQLNQNKNTYMYMLNKPNNKKENADEKPW